MFFFSQDEFKRKQAMKMFEIIAPKEGLEFLGWRKVPTRPEVLGKKALDVMPGIYQCFVKKPEDCEEGLPFDRKLYILRKVFEQSNEDTYVVSLSSRTIVYKGMFLVGQLRTFLRTLTVRIMNQPLHLSTQDSVPTPIQAGEGRILTDL